MFSINQTYVILIILDIFSLVAVGFSEVYQPTQQEIDRFQLIQEQIRQHQQQEKQQKQLQLKQQQQQQLNPTQPETPFLISPILSHLATMLINKHIHNQQQQEQDSHAQQTQQLQVSMMNPQPPSMTLGHLAHMQQPVGNMHPHQQPHRLSPPFPQPSEHNQDLLHEINNDKMTNLISHKLDNKKVDFNVVRRPDSAGKFSIYFS